MLKVANLRAEGRKQFLVSRLIGEIVDRQIAVKEKLHDPTCLWIVQQAFSMCLQAFGAAQFTACGCLQQFSIRRRAPKEVRKATRHLVSRQLSHARCVFADLYAVQEVGALQNRLGDPCHARNEVRMSTQSLLQREELIHFGALHGPAIGSLCKLGDEATSANILIRCAVEEAPVIARGYLRRRKMRGEIFGQVGILLDEKRRTG